MEKTIFIENRKGITMAIKNLLRENHLEDFKAYLEQKGFMILPTTSTYEALRAKKAKETIVVYHNEKGKGFLSIAEKDYAVVMEFLKTR